MPMQPGKRTIEYTLPSAITLADFRQIVRDTEELEGDSRIELPRSMGQLDAEYVRVIITEEWPPNATK
jgi:hypothetical protein